jgi:hypothetical protein
VTSAEKWAYECTLEARRTSRKLRMEEHSKNVERETTTYAAVAFLEQNVSKNAYHNFTSISNKSTC